MRKLIRKRIQSLRERLSIPPEKRVTRAQLSALLREKQLMFQLAKNFRDLEGSWRGYFRRLRLIMQGEPGKKE